MRLNLLPDGFYCRMRAQKSIGERFVFPQQAQQQVLGLYVRASKLARFVSRKKDDSTRFFCIPFKHDSCRLSTSSDPSGGDRFPLGRFSVSRRLEWKAIA